MTYLAKLITTTTWFPLTLTYYPQLGPAEFIKYICPYPGPHFNYLPISSLAHRRLSTLNFYTAMILKGRHWKEARDSTLNRSAKRQCKQLITSCLLGTYIWCCKRQPYTLPCPRISFSAFKQCPALTRSGPRRRSIYRHPRELHPATCHSLGSNADLLTFLCHTLGSNARPADKPKPVV